MRLIAERLLAPEWRGKTYLAGELSRERPKLPPPSVAGKRFHVCCSPNNLGAASLMNELRDGLGLSSLRVSNDLDEVSESARFLVYLTKTTWTHSPEAFGRDVERAMREGTRLLVCHEYPGLDLHSGRDAVPFQQVLLQTPQHLQAADIYHMIAIALKAGEWRQASLVMLGQELSDGIGVGQRVAWCRNIAELLGRRAAVGGSANEAAEHLSSRGGRIIIGRMRLNSADYAWPKDAPVTEMQPVAEAQRELVRTNSTSIFPGWRLSPSQDGTSLEVRKQMATQFPRAGDHHYDEL